MSDGIIIFDHVEKDYNGSRILSDMSFSVDRGDFVTLIGRSGCGKTTALKLINALVSADGGRVLVRGEDVRNADHDTLRRSIGYVIQNVGLFPHMTIEENIAYVPSISHLEGWGKKERKEKVAQLLASVQLDPEISSRYPRSLSGGQKQRVGIARALASSPDILLMDEPFAAVDEITREALQDQILQIHKKGNITVVFVTHDIAEAFKLGTRTLVMADGHIEQYDRPSVIYSSPATPFTAELIAKSREFSLRA